MQDHQSSFSRWALAFLSNCIAVTASLADAAMARGDTPMTSEFTTSNGERRHVAEQAVVDFSRINLIRHDLDAVPRPRNQQAKLATVQGAKEALMLTASFAAHVQTNGIAFRPDATGAVDSEHVVSMTSDGIRIQRHDGSLIGAASLQEFWSGVGPFTGRSPGSCDTNLYEVSNPQIRYDGRRGRWIATASAGGLSADHSILLGVSTTTDPGGTWYLRRIRADAALQHVYDFPNVGFGPRWIIIQAGVNVGYNSSSQTSGGSYIWVFDKRRLYAGDTNVAFTLFKRSDLNYSQHVVLDDNDDGEVQYLVGLGPDFSSDVRNSLRLYTISGQTGHEVFAIGPNFTSPVPWRNIPSGGFSANTLPQLGTNQMIAPQDSVPLSAVWRDGSIWVAHHVQFPSTTTRRTSVQWWQLDPRGKILQRGLIDDPSSQHHYAFPALAVNRYGEMLIGYSRFSSNQFPSANYAWRLANDPSGTVRGDRVLKEGESPFVWRNPCAVNRTEWGWYSATTVGSDNLGDFWTLQQYAAKPVEGHDRWGVWWGHISRPDSSPEPLTLRVSAPARVTAGDDPLLVDVSPPLKPSTRGISLCAMLWNRGDELANDVRVRVDISGGCIPTFIDPADHEKDLNSGEGFLEFRTVGLRPGDARQFYWSLCAGGGRHGAAPGALTNVVTVTHSSGQTISVTNVISILTDNDDDDLPDDWESARHLDPTRTEDADDDLDGDGLSNRLEYQAGTEPEDPASLLRLTAINRLSAGAAQGIRLTFRAVPGRFYRIERTDTLTDPHWIAVATELRAASNSLTVTDPDHTSSGPRFYRAVVLP